MVQPQAAIVAVPAATKMVETRYEMGSYRDPTNLAIRHEAHAVFRQTRVPSQLESESSRTQFPPASYAPLPPSAELAAELLTQKTITAEMQAMRASMAEMEQRMQRQYTILLQQNAELSKVREQWEKERAHVRNASASEPVVPAETIHPENTEAKW